MASEWDRLSRDISTVSSCTNRSGATYHNTDHLAISQCSQEKIILHANINAIPHNTELNFTQNLKVSTLSFLLSDILLGIGVFSSWSKPPTIPPDIILFFFFLLLFFLFFQTLLGFSCNVLLVLAAVGLRCIKMSHKNNFVLLQTAIHHWSVKIKHGKLPGCKWRLQILRQL